MFSIPEATSHMDSSTEEQCCQLDEIVGGPIVIFKNYTDSQEKKIRKRRLFKKVQGFCDEKISDTSYGYYGMLNPKNNVGKLRNGVFSIYFAYFQDGRKIEENSIKICRVSVNDAKLVQINPKHLLMIGGLH